MIPPSLIVCGPPPRPRFARPRTGSCAGRCLVLSARGPPGKRRPSSVFDPGCLNYRNLVEMVDPGGIASGDLGLLLFSAVLQNLLNDLVAPGEGGFDM